MIGTICHLYFAYGAEELPCHFADSINITDGRKSSSGNIIYERVTYTRANYGKIDYIMTDFYTVKVKVASHIRGCICNIKTCVRYCCQPEESCGDVEKIVVNTTAFSENGELQTIDIKHNEHYAILYGDKPCKKMFLLQPESEPEDLWELLKVRKCLNF